MIEQEGCTAVAVVAGDAVSSLPSQMFLDRADEVTAVYVNEQNMNAHMFRRMNSAFVVHLLGINAYTSSLSDSFSSNVKYTKNVCVFLPCPNTRYEKESHPIMSLI
jgi:hypothetical protein